MSTSLFAWMFIFVGLVGCQSGPSSLLSQPHAAEALLQLAEAHQTAGRLDTAAALIDRAEQIAPTDPLVHRARAEWHMARGEVDAAHVLYRQYWQYDPAMALAYGRLLASAGAHATALPVLAKAAESRWVADQASALSLRGEVYRTLGQDQKAELDFVRALELSPQNAASATALCNLLLSQGRFPEAKDVLDQFRTQSGEELAIASIEAELMAYADRLRVLNPRFGRGFK